MSQEQLETIPPIKAAAEPTTTPIQKPKKPTSPRKLKSCRENGAKSKGPITPAGRLAASKNAPLKHGMLSQTLVLPAESRARFDALAEDLINEHQPMTRTELSLVENMISARWRQLRTWSFQRNDLAREISKHDGANVPAPMAAAIAFRSLAEQSPAFNNSHRYETAYDRQFKSALNELAKVQARREKSSAPYTPIARIDSSPYDAVYEQEAEKAA